MQKVDDFWMTDVTSEWPHRTPATKPKWQYIILSRIGTPKGDFLSIIWFIDINFTVTFSTFLTHNFGSIKEWGCQHVLSKILGPKMTWLKNANFLEWCNSWWKNKSQKCCFGCSKIRPQCMKHEMSFFSVIES